MSSPVAAPSRRRLNFSLDRTSLDRTLPSPLYHIASISSYLMPVVVGVVMVVLVVVVMVMVVLVGRGGEAGGVVDTRGVYRGGGYSVDVVDVGCS
jgi:hypothetical protein